MSVLTSLNRKGSFAALSLSLFAGLLFGPSLAIAQNAEMNAAPAAQTSASSQQAMQEQITELKEQVDKLQGALQQRKGTTPARNRKRLAGESQPAMGMEGRSTEMGGMGGSTQGGMVGAKRMRNDGTPMPESGCCGMGSMGKPMTGPMAVRSSRMPGVMRHDDGGSMARGASASSARSGSTPAGTPSLMHAGAKDFFLDDAHHITLSAEQKASLEKIKANAGQQKSAFDMQINEAQQDLWRLTGAGQPNLGQIDEKVQQIARLRADQQSAYIHAVADAANVLTPEQQRAI